MDWVWWGFQASLLGETKGIARNCVVSALRNIAKTSNFNLIGNVDRLIARIDTDSEVRRVGKKKIKVDSSKVKTSYWFLVQGQYNLFPEIWAIVIYCFLIDVTNFGWCFLVR